MLHIYEKLYCICSLTNNALLFHRNLTKNPLRSFTGNLSGLLFSLTWVDATGIVDWIPENIFLRLRMLKEIIGWGSGWREKMFCNCSLYRKNVTWSPEPTILRNHRCFVSKITVNNHSFAVNMLNNTDFASYCSKNLYIDATCKAGFGYFSYSVDNPCWGAQLLALNCQSFLGGLAVLLNLVVFVTIITSKSLRKNVSMLFVCSMALSDLVLGVYFICIYIYLTSSSYFYLYVNSRSNCFKFGWLWVLGQAGSVFTSFFLTFERYLVIVYSMNQDVRITRRMAMMLITSCWLSAIFLTGYSLYQNSILCIPMAFSAKPSLIIHSFTISVGTLAILCYLITVIFYIHIYITVKRTAQDAGIKRESKLAKNIARLVSTNAFFFVLPVSCVSVMEMVGSQNINAVVIEFLSTVFLLMCLSLNSCFNPILHAFRTDIFTRVLKERFLCVQQRIRSILSACRGLHLTQRVQPENS